MNEEIQNEEDTAAEEVTVKRGRKAKAEEHEAEKKAPKFPVKLIRNYRPIGDFTIAGQAPSDEARSKVFAGTPIEIEIDEAKTMMVSGIGAMITSGVK